MRPTSKALTELSHLKTGNSIIEATLGGGFKYFLCSPLFGEDSQFD